MIEPTVQLWGGSDKFCILGDNFLGRDGKFHRGTTENRRWNTKQEAQAFLNEWRKEKKPEVKELTVAEISKKLGFEVKVVK